MNTPKTDALNKHIDAMPKTTGEWIDWAAQYAECSRRLETQVQELREALQRGMELCERGHGHEWADEARAILEKTK